MGEFNTFTGVKRKHQATRAVVMADIVARGLITVGGIGTIVAVTTVCVFLAWKVVPLFVSADSEQTVHREQGWPGQPLRMELNEFKTLGWALFPDGSLRVFNNDSGKTLYTAKLFEGKRATSSAFHPTGKGPDRKSMGHMTIGFDDGTVQFYTFAIKTTFFDPDQVPSLSDMREYVVNETTGEKRKDIRNYTWTARVFDKQALEWKEVEVSGVVEVTPIGQVRAQHLDVTVGLSGDVGRGKPVVMVDHFAEEEGDPNPRFAFGIRTEDAAEPVELRLGRIEKDMDMMTGEEKVVLKTALLKYEPPAGAKGAPVQIAMTGGGRKVYVAWPSGLATRYQVSTTASSGNFAEHTRLTPEGVALTTMTTIIGRETVIVGGDDGSLTGCYTVTYEGKDAGFVPIFRAAPGGQVLWVFRQGTDELTYFENHGKLEGDPYLKKNGLRGSIDVYGPDKATVEEYLSVMTPDGFKTVRGKSLPAGQAAVTSLAVSRQQRRFAAGFADGAAGVYQVTAENRFVHVKAPEGGAITNLSLTPKDDGLLALNDAGLTAWELEPGHPSATVRTLFMPVRYEGYAEKQHMYQSSAGSDDAEPKLGLYPLIFGTLKATFYAMIFGGPLALFAAVYSSEFLQPRIKTVIKPGIEMMASLPSVVLGFLAGLVFAPYVEDYIDRVLGLFIAVPVAFLLGAYLWQMLPYRLTILTRHYRFAFLMLPLVFGAAVGWFIVGPVAEQTLYLGNLRAYLSGTNIIPHRGMAMSGWMILFLPVSAFVIAFIGGRIRNHWMTTKSREWSRHQAATHDLFRFLIGIVATLVLALILSNIVGLFSDPRELGKLSFIQTYSQKNSLVVGFIMGFAVIPIIYSIAEDALSTVPDHLRSASLGAGATPWQTAVRIIIPTAMSGLFSATMIGLGRAVGETMIVLCAAGGTPITEVNIFNGFRTLSVNIANELPEAPVDGTLYRTLFLCGLVLFVMTFVINTVAEVVRQHFRKRAYQL